MKCYVEESSYIQLHKVDQYVTEEMKIDDDRKAVK